MKFSKLSAAALTVVYVLSVVVMVWMIAGCNKDSATAPLSVAPTPPMSSTPMVSMSVSFTQPGTEGFMKASNALFTDSLHIDSAIVVFSRIKFLHHVDSVAVDTGDAEGDSLDHDENIVFKGPFVVHIYDTVAIDLGSHELPAGSYDGIKFKIHRLKNGEHHRDCYKRHHHDDQDDSHIIGSSITVWGSVRAHGEWKPFRFAFNGELEFKVKGNFVVPVSTGTVMIALNIDMSKWFTNPHDGSLLNPRDMSNRNRRLIEEAIRRSFNNCRGGHDRGDGHPDD